MKTSNFKTYNGDNGVAICLYPPLYWKGEHFLILAPTKEIFFAKKADQISEKEYEELYKDEVLSKLDPQTIYNQFKDKILLCWEPEGEFCHRRIIADWIFESLGIEIPEWKTGDDDPKNLQEPLF